MADIKKLKDMIDAYGIGVRAGVITPCLQDENTFRKYMGLAPAPAVVEADWARTKGVRAPITLSRGVGQTEPETTQPAKQETPDAADK